MDSLPEQKVICILGMHRSGTSCLAGSLEEAGVYLGDVQRKNPYNLKGNCEHLKIMGLHDDLFAANGGSWDNPPLRVIWSDKHRMLRDEIIREYLDVPVWGFKDPRALFALDGWREVLPAISLVGTFRHPLAVARSLQVRNQFTLDKGYQIWLAYNRRLLEYLLGCGFPVISFDLEEEAYKQKLMELLPRLGLPSLSAQFVFYESGLRHGEKEDIPLPDDVRQLYEKLLELAG
jgi:hypothetical protein